MTFKAFGFRFTARKFRASYTLWGKTLLRGDGWFYFALYFHHYGIIVERGWM